MAKYNPKPKTSDGAIIFLTVCLMGAPEVLGPQLNHTLAVIMFWGGLSGLVLFLAARWGAWVWRETFSGAVPEIAAEKPAPAPDSPDNRGGNFAGRDNTGIQQAFHGPVTINQALPPPHPPIAAPAKPAMQRTVRDVRAQDYSRPSVARRSLTGFAEEEPADLDDSSLFLSMEEFTNQAYERTRGTVFQEMADRQNSQLQYYANSVIRNAKVYGKHYPSRVRELIPKRKRDKYIVWPDLNTLSPTNGDVDYYDLEVEEAALDGFVEFIRGIGMVNE